jgi:hypothetical protein
LRERVRISHFFQFHLTPSVYESTLKRSFTHETVLKKVIWIKKHLMKLLVKLAMPNMAIILTYSLHKCTLAYALAIYKYI